MEFVLHEEVYDDATGQWISQDGEDAFPGLELAWETGPGLLELLERRDTPFSRTEAFTLCAEVILNDFGGDVLTALLDRCPPLEEFLDLCQVDYPIPDFWGYLGLTELAAYLGRETLLDILLRRGGNRNALPTSDAFPVSPLEAAAWGGNPACVERLLAEPETGLSFSAHLQRLWAKPHLDQGQRRCLGRIVPRVAGTDFPPQGPAAIPKAFCPMVAVEMGNQDLFLRLCHERGRLSPREADQALDMLWAQAALAGRQDPPDMLLALLKLSPELLERKECRALLVLNAAECPWDARLEPWLRRLRGRALPLKLLAEHFPGWEEDGVQTQRARRRIALA